MSGGPFSPHPYSGAPQQAEGCKLSREKRRMGSRQGCPSFINQTQRLVALSSSALAGWAGSAASVFCQNGEHSPARVPLFGCPVPEVGSQGMSPFLFWGFGGFRIKTHFWSWIDSYLLPTLFCLVFHGAFSWSFSFDHEELSHFTWHITEVS